MVNFMSDITRILTEDVLKDHEHIVTLRRYFHMHPELAKEEFNTQQKIEEELDAIGIDHKRIAGTGVYAELKGEKEGNRTIVLRADIDALPVEEKNDVPYKSFVPGKKHACGHDAHAASLIGAARTLSRHRDLFGGTVRFIWQPGEEIGYGARIIVDEGYVDGADRTFGIHLSSGYPAGTICIQEGPQNASVDWFKIKVHGHGAHVAQPEMGVDAAYICAQILVSLQSIATRMMNPMENVLVGIGKISAGDAYNVVAQEGELEGTVRVYLPEIRKAVKEHIESISEHVAAIYGGTVEFEWRDNASPLINDAKAAREAQKTAAELFGKDKVLGRKPEMGGDDMAEFILRVPGVYCFAGSANAERPDTCVAHHDSRFDIDEDCLRVSALMYAAYAVEFLEGINEEA